MDEKYTKEVEDLKIALAHQMRIEAIKQDMTMPIQTERDMWWLDDFDERQQRLIRNCRVYAHSDPAGLPGHQLQLIISKLADLLDNIKDV
jgi:hypothetical protein